MNNDINNMYTDTKENSRKSFTRQNATDIERPTSEQAQCRIDLNEQLVTNKHATFFFRMNGDAMNGAGIYSGDVLIVDRSITNINGKVVVALLDGEMIVRRLEKTFNKTRLVPETTKLSAIEIDPFADCSIWGVVTYVIHTL